MDMNLVSTFIAAQVGQIQLAAAGYLAQNDPQSGSSVGQLVDAAQQDFNPLANVSAGLGTSLDISC